MEQVGRVTRRGVLAAAVALPLAAAGCQGLGVLGTPPRPRPDVAVLRAAIGGETLLIGQYTAVLAAQPGLASLLAPLLGQHRAHLGRLRARLIVPPGAATPSPSPSPRAHVQVPGSTAAAQAFLQQAEHSAAQSLLGRLPAASPSLAQLLASIAASEASHALLLGPGRGAG
ncbi:MAG TPA: ferritin-like domain-containing protein [Streptosporangiaceae bacterium]